MRVRSAMSCAAVVLTCVTILILISTTPALLAAPVSGANAVARPTARFTLSTPADIPGSTLPPGSYMIHVVNRLYDRVIVQVDSTNGDLHSTFIGIPNKQIARPSGPGMIDYVNPSDGAQHLRGWYFPGSSAVVEFVYPKATAVAIANSNQVKVPAIDPASDGLAADPTLSPKDMQLVTLWLLSAERVSPSNNSANSASATSIKAERYEQASAAAPRKPVVGALPHTASYLPWVWLLSLCSLLGAAIVRVLRIKNASSAGQQAGT